MDMILDHALLLSIYIYISLKAILLGFGKIIPKPTLFSAFINDIVEAMNKITFLGVVINNINITVLQYADDLVLSATSQEGLQSGLDLLKTYCEENKLTVNVSKSKAMCV